MSTANNAYEPLSASTILKQKSTRVQTKDQADFIQRLHQPTKAYLMTTNNIKNKMNISNHEYDFINRLKINLFTPTPRGVN